MPTRRVSSPDGPVTVYAPGFRNPYDIVLTAAGRLYTIDNGANPGWGDAPLAAGGRCTNEPRPGGEHQDDTLHYIRAAGYYGGHPNPTRANPANLFAGQSPVTTPRPEECEFRPGKRSGALTTFPASTNGLVEYRSQAFGGKMAGNLLTASFDNRIYRLLLRPDGGLARKEILFEDRGAGSARPHRTGRRGGVPGHDLGGRHRRRFDHRLRTDPLEEIEGFVGVAHEQARLRAAADHMQGPPDGDDGDAMARDGQRRHLPPAPLQQAFDGRDGSVRRLAAGHAGVPGRGSRADAAPGAAECRFLPPPGLAGAKETTVSRLPSRLWYRPAMA